MSELTDEYLDDLEARYTPAYMFSALFHARVHQAAKIIQGNAEIT